MAIYTLTTDLIEKMQSSEIHLFGSLFHVFTNVKSGNKLAIDKNKRLYSVYTNAIIDSNLKLYYQGWLDLFSKMLNEVCEFVPIDIDISDKDRAFLDLASSINGSKKIIVYCRNSNCPYECDDENVVEHNGEKIHVLDKEDAILEINSKVINNITTEGDNSPINFGNNNKVKIKIQKQ